MPHPAVTDVDDRDGGRLAAAVIEWFAHAARPLPWRAADVSPWAVLVSEFMLQQTQVGRVQPRWEAWVARWPTPAALAAEPPAEAVRAWDRLGYPRRALWLHRAATEIVERHGGEVPRDLDALLALQGIGPYTARAIAAFAFGDRHPVVDTNTRRVIARAVEGRAEAGPPATARDLAAMERLLPVDREAAHRFNAGAMELGATVCTARAPQCDACPIVDRCAWRAAGYPAYDGPRRTRQARFEGSDREARGLVMRELRAAHRPVPADDLARVLPDDPERFRRALGGLVADGLAVASPDGYALPHA
ncbi:MULTISPECIES: A/G-specific adenine glycosylase [unclassified Agromyces]|uniref:A/G-specific adenine glycosylase n=1 Tax=unclassified Agromyces TaxID=2639701 RepID=UPI003014CF9C